VPAQVKREVTLIIPIYPKMEFAAAQTASILAELMEFEEDNIEEIQLAIIETCINAFEHSQSDDQRVFITFLMGDDELELKITDHGVGFRVDGVNASKIRRQSSPTGLQKRGWGLEIIRHMMDEVKIESNEDGTTITMVKKKRTNN
jgi:anti-sigma regulatory factor (Ser/Thr protein kinase)